MKVLTFLTSGIGLVLLFTGNPVWWIFTFLSWETMFTEPDFGEPSGVRFA